MKSLKRVYNILLKEYGPRGWWPIISDKTLSCEYYVNAPRNSEDSFEIICGAILTQNTNWYHGVIRALQQLKLGRQLSEKEIELLKLGTANLKSNNKILPEYILGMEKDRLKELIRPAGYFNQKATYLKEIAKFYEKKKTVPKREELLEVKGVGNETADSILLYAHGMPEFVVDVYTRRIFSSLGIIRKDAKYNEIKAYFESRLEKSAQLLNEYHALIVAHGKAQGQKIY
ncbi:endonuclease III domain-containing protein [Candidatus Woesearchaeota archaeon]|nr:endonuclease III domain-containing protein [Candidatus Woesearchaeota archaeon]